MNPTTYKNPNANFFQTQSNVPVNITPDATTLGTPNKSLNLSATPVIPIPQVAGLGVAPTEIVTPTVEQPRAEGVDRLDQLFSSLGNQEADIEAAKIDKSAPFAQQLNQVNQQQAMLQATALANQEKAMRSGETLSFASREAQNIARTDAIESLKLSAIQAGLQGNIALAERQAESAIKAKYSQITKDLETARTNIVNNYESFTSAEKKRANATLLRLDKDDAFVKMQQTEDLAIQNLGIKLAENGVDTATIKSVMDSGDFDTAIRLAGSKLQDPTKKAQLESIRLDQQLSRIQIQKATEDLAIFRKYGGLTPSQYRDQIEADAKQAREESESKDKAVEDGFILDTSIKQIDTILGSSALDDVVGGSFLTRGIGRQTGKTTTLLSALTTGFGIGSIKAEFGKADDTVLLIQNILDQQFLDKLISVKAQGATFGALTDREGDALRKAANAISGAAIERDGKVIGYDMSEKEFKQKMKTTQDLMRKAYEKATGKVFDSAEQTDLDKAFGDTSVGTDASLYFN